MPETEEYRPKRAEQQAISTTETIEYIGSGPAHAGEAKAETHMKTAVRPGPSFSQKMDRLRRLSDEVVESLPRELLNGLHGGIALTERTKLHPKAEPGRPLLVRGEYCRSNQTGRHIMLYGGSILRVYGGYDDERLRAELDRIIRHELTHHWESLSGTRDLEIYDSEKLEEYRNGN